jgi:hypothetical protein
MSSSWWGENSLPITPNRNPSETWLNPYDWLPSQQVQQATWKILEVHMRSQNRVCHHIPVSLLQMFRQLVNLNFRSPMLYFNIYCHWHHGLIICPAQRFVTINTTISSCNIKQPIIDYNFSRLVSWKPATCRTLLLVGSQSLCTHHYMTTLYI